MAWGFTINPLTPEAFCKNHVFWTFWRFSGWIAAKLALIQSKMRLQHDSLLLLPLYSLNCVVRPHFQIE